MKRLVARFGARILEALGIVIDDVDAADLPMTTQSIRPPPTKEPKHEVDVVVVVGRINDRRFLTNNPGHEQ